MDTCPYAALLELDNFHNGTPREEIQRLRENHRIVWQTDDYDRGGHWLVLQRDDIDTVLKTPGDFSNAFGPLLEDFPGEILAEQQQSLTFMDPPRHREYRRLADYAFRSARLAQRLPLMRETAQRIVDRIIDRGECEFIEEVALPLPVDVMFRLLGVRDEDFQQVVDLTNTLTLANDPDYAEDRMAGFMASMKLLEFGEALAQDHRAHPRDSMTMEMLEAEVEGHSLDSRAFGRFFVNLIVGGVETTRNTLGWLFHELIRNPGQYRLLQRDLSLVPAAVEEALRLRNTVVYLRRTATRDMDFAGEKIRQGDKLICVLGAPNRDPRYFDRPDEFDITRKPAQTRRGYRTFGAGPHFCIGVHQARMNLEVMTEEIARRMDNLRLLREPTHFRSNFMDGFKAMPIAFDRAAQ
ncbi:MAG: cytochrome P450 [Halioglobus sp.]|nr:cytochrome P450 [Halioglobus sp.]